MVDKTAVQRLKQVASTPFERCTYTRAIQLLEEAVKGGKKFEFPVMTAAFPKNNLGVRHLAEDSAQQRQTVIGRFTFWVPSFLKAAISLQWQA